MMLVYSLPQIGAIFDRFGGINGSAYVVGGIGRHYLRQITLLWFPFARVLVCDLERIPAT